MQVFKRGGAQYVYMTAKHSDGFALWPSVYRHGYNSMATIGRDLFGELMSAVVSTQAQAICQSTSCVTCFDRLLVICWLI